MTNPLLALKLGFLIPSLTIVTPYLSADLAASKGFRPGFEVGAALDPVRTSFEFFGKSGTRVVYMGSALVGMTWAIRKDLSLSSGVKFRPADKNVSPYGGIAFRFRSMRSGR